MIETTVPLRRPKQLAEIACYNQGIADILAIAAAAASVLAGTRKRRAHEDFAINALDELANAGRSLLQRGPSGDLRD